MEGIMLIGSGLPNARDRKVGADPERSALHSNSCFMDNFSIVKCTSQWTKVRVFSNPPCSNMPEAVHLGDLLRIWVRPGARFTPSGPDFQGPARAHRTSPEPRRFPGRGPLSRDEPIPGRPALHKEKRTLPGAAAGFSGVVCVTALGASRRLSPPSRFGDLNPIPFRSAGGDGDHRPNPSERRSPIP